MRLISCHVENFGRLHDFDYTFSDGVNVICRENGWGKSTFAAFLLAMFYGLPAKGKKGQAVSGGNRLPAQYARAAYRPWQGGVCGGKLIFETGGRSYEMTRIFGNRESEDEFDLRDFDTNLPSFDFTKNIGRELFSLDCESFRRTVFTSQQDCLTEATDDVNALIADLAENAGDMESYEAAQRRLREAANRLTPKRATGKLYRINEQIGELEQRRAASDDLEDRIARCRREQEKLRQKKESLEAERAGLSQAIEAAQQEEEEKARREAAGQGLLAKRQIWQRLYRTEERRRQALEKADAFFPGSVPSRARADQLLQNCREMERLENRMQAQMLTPKEQERLTLLEEHFSDLSVPPEKEKANTAESRKSIVILLTGILLLIAGALLFATNTGPGSAGGGHVLLAGAAIVLAAAGAGIAVAGIMAWRDTAGPGQRRRQDRGVDSSGGEKLDFPMRRGAQEPQEEKHRPAGPGGRNLRDEEEKHKSAGPAEGDFRNEEEAVSYAEYVFLEKKEEKLEETYAEWKKARKPVLRFLRELGFAPEKDLHAQLISIRDAADDCEDVAALLKESVEELRQFEEEFRRSVPVSEADLCRSGLVSEADLADFRRSVPVSEADLCCSGLVSEADLADFRRSGPAPETDLCRSDPDSAAEPGLSDRISVSLDAASLLLRKWEEQEAFEKRRGDTGELVAAVPSASDLPHAQPRKKERASAVLLARLDRAHEELLQCRNQSAEAEQRMQALLLESEERDAILEELRELREEQEADLRRYRHITAASVLLQKARESLTARYADPIRVSFSRYWEMITGYSAAGVYVDANSRITVEERGKQREVALLSTGWRDLAGICLRTALADAMYPPGRRERPPLILDDPFTNLDDEKTEGAMRFLREAGRHYQILYFTCSSARC